MSAQTDLEFSISDAAVQQVRSIMSQQTLEADERNLRIFVEGGGCCGGVGYGLAFDKAQDGDVRIERSGLSIVIDPNSAPYVNGASIDFVNTPEMQGFKVSAPAMKSGGCGGGSCGPSGEGGGCGGGSCGSGGGGHSHGGGHAHGGGHGGGSCCG